MNKEPHPVEVLSFRRGLQIATIATDGRMHVSQEADKCVEHKTLMKGIAYLCAKGYTIDPSSFRVV